MTRGEPNGRKRRVKLIDLEDEDDDDDELQKDKVGKGSVTEGYGSSAAKSCSVQSESQREHDGVTDDEEVPSSLASLAVNFVAPSIRLSGNTEMLLMKYQ